MGKNGVPPPSVGSFEAPGGFRPLKIFMLFSPFHTLFPPRGKKVGGRRRLHLFVPIRKGGSSPRWRPPGKGGVIPGGFPRGPRVVEKRGFFNFVRVTPRAKSRGKRGFPPGSGGKNPAGGAANRLGEPREKIAAMTPQRLKTPSYPLPRGRQGQKTTRGGKPQDHEMPRGVKATPSCKPTQGGISRPSIKKKKKFFKKIFYSDK